jgi:hypothetical protein
MTDNQNQAPVSNTGQNSQKLSEGLTVKVDTIAGVCRNVPGLSDAYAIITLLEETFSDRIEFKPDEPTTMGKRWDGHTKSSLRGLRVWWQKPTDHEPGQLYIYAGGQVLGAATHKAAHDAFTWLGYAYHFEGKRFDVAIDDYDKGTPLEAVEAAAIAGNYAYCASHQIMESARRGENPGKTVYFGSPKSNKRVRCYDKSVESGGEIDAIRWEVQLRDDKADYAITRWLTLEPSDLTGEGARFLASLVTGGVHLCDRSDNEKNIDRCEVLPFWADFLARAAEGLRIPCPKKAPLLERSLEWLQNQVAPTLGVVRRVFGEGFDTYMEALIGGGENRHGSRHRALIAVAQSEGWSCATA